MIKLSKVPPNGITLQVRLSLGGSFMMFPQILEMGFYSIQIQEASDTDQEFIVFLLDKAAKQKNPRFHEAVSKHGTLATPLW